MSAGRNTSGDVVRLLSLLFLQLLLCGNALSAIYELSLCILLFINSIIIILGISFMQGIYTYIPETNHVPREHCVATIEI